MSKQKKMNRRKFLQLAAIGAAGVVLPNCAPTATPVSTQPPTETPPPTDTPKTPIEATTAATVEATTEVSKAAEEGSGLIGKLEGPEIIRDISAFPQTFSEAPMLADLVKAGKLPPIEERLPDLEDLMVIKPLHEIGQYGGVWRRAFTGPGDDENGNRINASDKILHFDYTGNKIIPALAKDWKVSDDGKTITIYLRKGAKWSDGEPLTADDFMFWYEDVYSNPELMPTPFPEMRINDKPGVMKKIDDFTIVFEFPESYAYFVYKLAGSTDIGGGFASRSFTLGGGYCPAHYLKQFLPKYSSEEALNKMAKDAGLDNWVALFKNKYNYASNPEAPVMIPWRTVSPITTPTWSLERNPYFWAVDTEGNQLPYIDKLTMTQVKDLEEANSRAIAGEYDLQERHMSLNKLPTFLENMGKGDYTVHLDPASNGSDAALHVNMAYEDDPEIAKWLKNKDFRHALSLGIDRPKINETLWFGVGVPGSIAPSPDTIYSPGPEWNKKWADLDIEQANDLLDQLELTEKDSEGYRLRTDGKGRLRLEMIVISGHFLPYPKVGEMVKQQWKEIGIDVDIKEMERKLAEDLAWNNNKHQIYIWLNDGSEILYLYPNHVLPVTKQTFIGTTIAKWYTSNGEQGTKPDDPEMLRAFDLFKAGFGLDEKGQIKNAKEIWRIAVEQEWSIGIVGQSPAFMGIRIAKNNMGNIPQRQINAQHARTPCTSRPATFYFKS